MSRLRHLFSHYGGLCALLLLFAAGGQTLHAQTKPKRSRILFVLDFSSSMTLKWSENYTRHEIASTLVLQIVDSIYRVNNEVEFGVRTVGTRFPAQEKNCFDTELDVPFNVQNASQIKTRLKYIRPIGYSPIAYSLAQAAGNELNQAHLYDYSIVFITDGGESCDGDVCKTYRDFVQNKIKVKPYVIGLDKNPQLKLFYECLGEYVEVGEQPDMAKAVQMVVNGNRPLTDKPKQMNLVTEFAKPAPIPEEPKTLQIPTAPPSKNIFPRLLIQSIPRNVNGRIILQPAYAIVRRGEPVTLRFTVEETPMPPKPVVMTRDAIIVPRMRMLTLPWAAKTPARLKASSFTTPRQSVTLRFSSEETPKPAPQRVAMVVPRMKPVTLPKPPAANNRNLATKRATLNAEKVSLRFEVDAPRQNMVVPRMKPAALPLPPAPARRALTAKRATLKSEKVSLRFEVEAPRQNIVVPRIAPISKTYVNTRKPLPKGQRYLATRGKVDLVFREDRKPERLTELRVNKYPMRYSYAFRLPTVKPMRQARSIARIRFEVDPPRKRDTMISKPESKPASNNSDFAVETEPSPETQVQVFFRGPDEKSYIKARPEIEVYDSETKKLVSSFRRDMNGSTPVPQPIKPGKYTIVVKGQSDLVSSNVVIEASKTNKVYIRVTDGTLAFAYLGNRNRPVEFNAIVNRRFAAGATVLQKCSDRLMYEPGTYYVEINTLPATKFSVDLTFGAVYELQIPEPGTLQISNTSPYGKIQLQSVLGDQYLSFLNVNVDGNLQGQRFILQPGPYKAIVPVNPSIPQAGTKIIDFRVSSNRETLLEIK